MNTNLPLTEADLVIESRSATSEDTAAVTAVLSVALSEASADPLEGLPRPSAWEKSQRSLRRTITHGDGAWRSFSA
jgi:hypothetical protein